ncbi:hypothetical protein OG21DRAFT_1522291 [Imleria badia]|nr:hypothetical protein OG21DRAFT_1522291 [Imleria badia]
MNIGHCRVPQLRLPCLDIAMTVAQHERRPEYLATTNMTVDLVQLSFNVRTSTSSNPSCLVPVPSTSSIMSESPTMKYRQPQAWFNAPHPSPVGLAERVPSLRHRCRIVRTEPRRRIWEVLRRLQRARGRQGGKTIDGMLSFFGENSEVVANISKVDETIGWRDIVRKQLRRWE